MKLTPNISQVHHLSPVVHVQIDLCPGSCPLSTLVHKNVQFFWSVEGQKTFEYLKQAFTTTPDPALPLVVEKDASCTA